MKINKIIFILILCSIILPTYSVLASDPLVYKSATEYNYPPFSITEEGIADGFSVELLKAAAAAVNIEIEFKIDQWETIKSELKTGELDVLPLVGYSEERDEYFDFSAPYIVLHGNIFVRSNDSSINSENDLYGKEIIVMQGDTAHEYALKMNFTDNLILTKTYKEAFELLAAGKYDAVLAQSLVGEKLISDLNLKSIEAVSQLKNDGITRIKTNLIGFEQKFCFAVKEGDKELLVKLNEGLAIVSVDGTYNELYNKWFPFLMDNSPSTRNIIIYVGIIVVPIILLMLLIFLVSVKKEIKRKTFQLETANKERNFIEAHLRNQQKLESIGTLAGGVAHEINNPINGIMNYSQLILDASESASKNAEYAKEIIFESERIAIIVKNLLQFSRQEKQEHSYASVETIIEQTLSLIKAVMRHDQIELQIDIPHNLPNIKCRSQQIQQVIMNLLTNARDALNDKYTGYHENKVIKLYCEKFNKENQNWIRIVVEDYGNGIQKEAQQKLFEPFFTTKARDEGTGLGLPISYGIVKDHHGELTFETEEGLFTRFYLELPCDNGFELGKNENI